MTKLFAVASPASTGKVDLSSSIAAKLVLWLILAMMEGIVLIVIGAATGLVVGLLVGAKDAVCETYADMELLMNTWVKK